MPKPKLAAELAAALRDAETSLPTLQKIKKLAVIHDAPDASAALGEGCILLGVARVNDDEEGDGFRYLVGLPQGTEVTGYLSNFFGRD
jgi:hypothetical protein